MSASSSFTGPVGRSVDFWVDVPTWLPLALWLALLFLRYLQLDPTASQDLGIAVSFEFLESFTALSCPNILTHVRRHILFTVGLLIWLVRLVPGSEGQKPSTTRAKKNDAKLPVPWTKPLVLPCSTTHSRSFPQKHSFSYSYLFVGIPVGWHGRAGSLLSADTNVKRGWLHVDATGYLERGLEHMDLRQKLDHFLVGQGAEPSDFPFAYLATAPRVFGYSFNPVSFWYLYSANRELRAMILEVNNTFDERRMYLLHAAPPEPSKQNGDGQRLEEDDIGKEQGNSAYARFSSEWKKDFHVSPFNSREGSYTLLAKDLFADETSSARRVSNTIKLISSEGHVKLVARLFSTVSAIDPSACSVATQLWLFWHYGWVGFATFSRIIKEARTLYFGKKLTVWFRPEVTQSSISRHATGTEKILEVIFTKYLEHVVHQFEQPLCLLYTSAPGIARAGAIRLCSKSCEHDAISSHTDVEIKVSSPSFYSRFVHYTHTVEAINQEFLSTDAKNQTVFIRNPEALIRVFAAAEDNQSAHAASCRPDDIRWLFLGWARCSPGLQSYSSTPENHKPYKFLREDVRTLRSSPLDIFVRHHCRNEMSVYRRKVTELFLAQRFTAGFPVMITAVDWTTRSILGYYSVTSLVTSFQTTTEDSHHEFGNKSFLRFAVMILLSNALHIWALMKG